MRRQRRRPAGISGERGVDEVRSMHSSDQQHHGPHCTACAMRAMIVLSRWLRAMAMGDAPQPIRVVQRVAQPGVQRFGPRPGAPFRGDG